MDAEVRTCFSKKLQVVDAKDLMPGDLLHRISQGNGRAVSGHDAGDSIVIGCVHEVKPFGNPDPQRYKIVLTNKLHLISYGDSQAVITRARRWEK